MASTYVNDLRLNELGTGDGSGTWGTTTNTNLELIAEGLSFGTEAITTNADTHTSTVADGSTDPARSMFIKYTGTLDSACTITIAPNTISRVHFIENGTSGSQNIIIKQGSGATITIPPGDVKVVYLDGAGSGAAVVDAFASLSVVDLKVQDDLLLNSDSAVLSIGADADLKITHDGTNGDFESAGNLTFDVAGDINLDADGGEVNFQDGGTTVAYFSNSSSDLLIGVNTSDKDLYIQGNDGGSTINALQLDMSAAGYATFNAGGSFASTLSAPSVFGKTDTDTGIAFDNGTNILQLYTANTEAMRLDATGNLIINDTVTGVPTALAAAKVHIDRASETGHGIIVENILQNYAGLAQKRVGTAGVSYALYLINDGNQEVGTISFSNTATAYNTSSDYRLKTAVTYDWDATTRLKQLKPARFKWIADGDDAVFVDGFLAHECDAVPEAITGTKDAMRDVEYEVSAEEKDADGNVTKEAVMGTRSVPDYQGIDQSKLVPLLCKTILELEARITALESA
jgi:hypothetical protein